MKRVLILARTASSVSRSRSSLVQSLDDRGAVPDLAANPATSLQLGRDERRAAATERVQDEVALHGGDVEHAVQELEW